MCIRDRIELKRPAVLAVSGLHNSGKTTLLEKLLPDVYKRQIRYIPRVAGMELSPK